MIDALGTGMRLYRTCRKGIYEDQCSFRITVNDCEKKPF